jgi:hypothetical protein
MAIYMGISSVSPVPEVRASHPLRQGQVTRSLSTAIEIVMLDGFKNYKIND